MGDAVTNRMRAAEWCGTHEPKVEYLQCGDSRMCMTALLDEAEQRGRDAGVREELARCEEAVANAVAFIMHGSEDAAKRVDLLPPIDEADEKQLRTLTEAHVATRATRSIAKPVEPVYMCSSPCLLRTGHTGRCFSSYKPVEPPVCQDWCGTESGGCVSHEWCFGISAGTDDWLHMCSSACRALGRPANPRRTP